MPTPKYFGGDLGGSPAVYWPGDADGYPYRSRNPMEPPPLTRESEFRKLVHEFDVGVRVFDLAKAEDLADYTAVLDLAANGYATIHRERTYDHELHTWKVLCEWKVIYATSPVGR